MRRKVVPPPVLPPALCVDCVKVLAMKDWIVCNECLTIRARKMDQEKKHE